MNIEAETEWISSLLSRLRGLLGRSDKLLPFEVNELEYREKEGIFPFQLVVYQQKGLFLN